MSDSDFFHFKLLISSSLIVISAEFFMLEFEASRANTSELLMQELAIIMVILFHNFIPFFLYGSAFVANQINCMVCMRVSMGSTVSRKTAKKFSR